jgi:succinoglycan biosynthesis transport protein ExoP
VQQFEKPQPSVIGPEFPASPTLGERIDFLAGFLHRQYFVVLVFLLLSLPVGAFYLLVTPSTYTASAVMMIETRKGQLHDSLFGDTQPNSSWIESQIGVIKSQNVAAYVARQLRLADDPQFIATETSWLDKLLIRIGLRTPPAPKSEAERTGEAIAAVIGGLDVRRVGLSYMMRIDYRSHNRTQAVRIANAVIDGYVFDQLNAKYEANRRAGDWLQERLQALREQASAAERAVVEFKAKNNIIAAGGKLMNEQQLSDVSSKLAGARARTSDIQLRLERIAAVREAYQENQPSASVADETVTEAMNNAIISRLRSQYLDLVYREAEWSAKYGANHNAVVNVRNQIRNIRKAIRDELGRIEETHRSEYEIAQRRQEELEKSLAALISQSTETNQAQVTLFSLDAAAKSYRRLYDTFLKQHTETVQQQSYPITDARQISPAYISTTSPNWFRVWMVTIFAGGMLGVGIGALREIMDRKVRSREQVRTVLETECLALVPRLTTESSRRPFNVWDPVSSLDVWQALAVTSREKREPAAAAGRTGHSRSRRIESAPAMLRTVVESPSSRFAEAIETIKLTVDLSGPPASTRIIGLTSCFASEGKSTIAMGLAAQIARDGGRVILVDCDLRNPTLSRALAPDASAGLFEVVGRNVPIAEVIWNDTSSRIAFLPTVLPTVVNPRSPSPTNILASDGTKSLFHALQVQYDYVIVDLPPLASSADVRATSRFINCYILVVEWGSTRIDAVQYALRNAPDVAKNIIGTVLNKVDIDAMSRYDRYGATYYYGRSGSSDLRH